MRATDWLWSMARSRFLRGVAMGVLLTLGGLTLLSSYLWGLALQDECEVVPRADLSLDEMVEVKLKVDASEREGSSQIVFNGKEASFLLREVLRLPIFVDVEGDALVAQAAFPRRDQCYNIHFRGGVAVEGGVVVLHPERLVVGDLDLTSWTEQLELGPLVLREAGAQEILQHVERLAVQGNHVEVKVDDVGALR